MGAFLFSTGIVSVCLFMFGINLDLMGKTTCQAITYFSAYSLGWLSKQTSYKTRMLVGLILCVIADMLLEFRKSTLFGVIFFLLGPHFTLPVFEN